MSMSAVYGAVAIFSVNRKIGLAYPIRKANNALLPSSTHGFSASLTGPPNTQNNCQNGCNLADGVLYTVNQGSGDGGNGLFIGKYIGAARGKGWSSHGGDHCGSGCIQSSLIEW